MHPGTSCSHSGSLVFIVNWRPGSREAIFPDLSFCDSIHMGVTSRGKLRNLAKTYNFRITSFTVNRIRGLICLVVENTDSKKKEASPGKFQKRKREGQRKD